MKVRDLRIARSLDLLPHLGFEMRVARVEQHGGGIAQQVPCPYGDHGAAHDAHDGIEPDPAEIAAGQKGDDRQDRRQRVGQDVGQR